MSQTPSQPSKPNAFFASPLDCLFTMTAAIAAFWATPLVFDATYPSVHAFAHTHYDTFLIQYISPMWFGATLLATFLGARATLVTTVRLISAVIASRFS